MPSFTVNTDKPVMVSGATGYIAGRVVERLLQAGLTVHATVRDPSNTERLAYLEELAAHNPGSLRFFAANLLEEGSFAEAMEGCGVVFHVASPFVASTNDPQKTLVEPAVNGTRNVMEQAGATPSVERVVLTGSCGAIYCDNADLELTEGGVFTEEHWNTTSSLEYGAYSYSKTLAEKEAWRLAEAQSRYSLVVLNPSMVMGPGVAVHAGSESVVLFKQFGDGSLKPGVPDLGMGIVDIRDVAEAHLRAAFTPEASGRIIISGHNTSFPEMAKTLVPTFGDRFPIPRRVMPKFILWLVGSFVNPALTRSYVSKNVGWPWKGDSSKSVRVLGMTYRPLQETTVDMFQQLVDAGELQPK